jgi:hypothetical protein
MATINELLNKQRHLAKRLTYLNEVVNSLMRDDCTRHEHTINYYLRELEEHRQQAEDLNRLVDDIVKRSTQKHGLERF